MPKPKNAYLAKKAEKQRVTNQVVAMWSHQMCYDAITLVLNDKNVMGKDVFGKERIKKISDAMNAKIGEIMPALSGAASASYIRAQVDRELAKICREDFEPWEVRYPYWDDRGI